MINLYKLLIYTFLLTYSSSLFAKDNPFKILHVMSYHKDWIWNINQFQGFKDGIKNSDIEYKVVELDTKRNSNDMICQPQMGSVQDSVSAQIIPKILS